MKIIVVGGGKVGSALCQSLVEESHDVILIEEKETVLQQLTKFLDIMGIVGNGANYKILEEAGVSSCDIFIALTEKDEVNMIAAVLAKKMGAKETIVRMRNPEYSNSYFKDKNFLGFSAVINPELLAAQYIANSVEFPNAQSVEHFANGRVMLMEFHITLQSQLCHMTLSQFRKKFNRLVICAIKRGDEVIIPHGEATIQVDDHIFVTGNRVEMILFHNYVKNKYIKNLMLIGAGKITYYLLHILKNTNIKVKVLEISEARASWLSQEFPDLHIVHGDGTTKEILLEENVQNYDAVATLTGVDEENIITSMFLETLGVEKNITKVNRTTLLEIIENQLSSSIVVPKRIAVDSIMHFIRGRVNAEGSKLDAMHHLANERIETLQFEIKEGSMLAGEQLAQIGLKDKVLIAAIIRRGQTIFPTGDDALEIGDKVVVITLLKNIYSIKDLLER
ncbi:Trk system potassium transporter TrkA [Streptococcus cuniculipharyngis]|uniref:Trk system potassium uptake protein TrkA n=1 Tax=Streptococcus cuniculipharyngis TaxID=1562651 RepID=A0A5C5S8S9_9STRE|nr:Trk system potassium transporter TrkA [Streptococcus cuniculipharyngis]TWS96667.1 Trk system potassium transporter TrkA [Streptococcus cuniculipharyngis]